MKKLIAAATAGLLLVAGQAAAAQGAAPRLADRVGATAEDSSEIAGIPLTVLIAGAAVLVAVVVIANDDDSDSD